MTSTSVHHLHSSPDRKSEAQDVCKEIYQPFLTSLPLDFVCGELELVWMRCHIQRTRGYWYRDFKLPSCFDDHVHVYHDHHLSLVSPLSSWLLLHCHHIHDIFFIVISQWPQLVACFHLSSDQTLVTFHYTDCLIGIQITGSLDSP